MKVYVYSFILYVYIYVTVFFLLCKHAARSASSSKCLLPQWWNTSVISYLIIWKESLQLHLSVAPYPPPPLFTHRYIFPSTHLPIHPASLCHLGLSIKNVLSPESGPIKGRIPGRRADKAYLINKCFTIIGARASHHTLPASLWYLIIHPFHSVKEGVEQRLTVSSQPNAAAFVCLRASGSGRGAASKHRDMQQIQMWEWHT